MTIRPAVAIALMSACVWAQDFRATIIGQITDPSGAQVPNATVKVVKDGTNETKEATSNASGFYTISFLDPGTYSIEISAPGFNIVRRGGVQLRVADKLNFSFALEVGTVAETVTVVGEQELIQTATASRGLVFDPIKVTEYPLNGRQSYMLMMLTPGVMFTQRTFGNTGFSGTRAWDVNGSYTMNGGRTGTNQFLLNGSPISSDGTWNLAPNVEAIQEFKVMVNTYDSQYGRSGGGHVNTTIKSGTNQWHGTLFDYWRNFILDANTTQNNRQGAPRGFRNQHQYGGTIGGAIRKDTDFVFFSFEGWQERTPFPTVNNTVPAEMRTGDGFTQYGQRIYDPMTSRNCVNGVDAPSCLSGGIYIRSPFPGNVIPANRISPIARAILGYYPSPNQVGARTYNQNWFRADNVGRYRYEQPMMRYDKVLGEKDRIYYLFSWQDGSEYRNQNGFTPPAEIGNMPGTVRTTMINTVDWTRVLSNNMVLDVRASYNPFSQNFPDVSDRSFTYDKVGIKNIPQVDTFPSKLMPRVNLDNFQSIFGNQFINQSSRKQISFTTGLAHTKGRHGMKYGFEWATVLRGNYTSGRSTGELSFDRFWTQQYSGRGQGFADGSPVATLLLGLQTGGSIAYNDTFYRREPYLAWYFQDDWKVNSKLTLNLGLRYDIQFPLYEINNRLNAGFGFDTKNPLSDAIIANWRTNKAAWDARNPATPYPAVPSVINGELLFAGVGGQPRRVYDWDLTNFQPRVGFAYNFLSKTVMRGGLGIFYRTATQGNITNGFSQGTPYLRSLDGGLLPSSGGRFTGPYSLDDPWPQGVIKPVGASLGPLTAVGAGLSVDGRQRRIPRTYQWSYGIERELGFSTVIEVSYVGSRTHFEPRASELGDMSYALFDDAQRRPNYYNTPVPNPFFGVLPTNTGRGASNTINIRDLLRRYPLYTGLSFNTNPWGQVWYHGMQLRFERRAFENRASGALTWVVSYTYAKQLEKTFIENRSYELGAAGFTTQIADIDRPHLFSLSGVWDFPFGKGRRFSSSNRVLDAIAGGWNYNWIYTYYAGVPTPVPDARFACGSYIAPDQTNLKWFNNDRSCYSQRPAFTFREVPNRFAWIRDPAQPQLNMAIVKRLTISERWSVELRGESFNFTNTPILRGPDTGFTSPTFGQLPIQQDNFARNIQLGARIRF